MGVSLLWRYLKAKPKQYGTLNCNVPLRGNILSSVTYFSTASKGLLDAAHFCYLMAQVGFGVYTRKTTKLVLIGSNHRFGFFFLMQNWKLNGFRDWVALLPLSSLVTSVFWDNCLMPCPCLRSRSYWYRVSNRAMFQTSFLIVYIYCQHIISMLNSIFPLPFLNSLPFFKFATNEAIQRTEAYEYAQSLGTQPGCLPNFQVKNCLFGFFLAGFMWGFNVSCLYSAQQMFYPI